MNMNLPNDSEVKESMGVNEAVKVLEKRLNFLSDYLNNESYPKDDEVIAITLAINFLQAYLKASAEMPEKKEEIKLADKKGNSRFNHYVRGFNDCREQAILAFMKSFEGFERTISELREQIAKGEAISEKEILKTMNKYWQIAYENPKCHNRDDRFKVVAQAIHALLTGKKGQNEKR